MTPLKALEIYKGYADDADCLASSISTKESDIDRMTKEKNKCYKVIKKALKEQKKIKVYKVSPGLDVYILNIEDKHIPIDEYLYKRIKEILNK